MLPVILLCLLSAAPTLPYSGVQEPSRDAVDGAVHRIEAAYEAKQPAGKIEALSTSGMVADPAVTKVAAMAFRDPDEGVRRAAIEALRFNEHPSALSALHSELGKPANHPRSPETTAALIRAVCQKGQAGSVPALSERTLDMSSRQVASAWILGMGRLRSHDSLVSVADYLQSLPASRRVALMDDFRISLMNLSGVDHGMDADAWITWWRAEGSSIEVPEELPEASPLMQQEYCDYWRVAPTAAHPEQFDVGEVAVAVDAPVAGKQNNGGKARRAKNETATANAERGADRPKREKKNQAAVADDAAAAQADKATRKKNAAAKSKDAGSPAGDAAPVEASAKPKQADKKNKKAAPGAEETEGADSPSDTEKSADEEAAPAKGEKAAKGDKAANGKKAGGKPAADGGKAPAKNAAGKKGTNGKDAPTKGGAAKGGAAKSAPKKGGAKKGKSKG